MGKFSELDLKWYEKEVLEDLEYEFHISERTAEELNALATNLYWKAQNLFDEANTLEGKSGIIRRYLDLIEK